MLATSEELEQVKANLLRVRASIERIVEEQNLYKPTLVCVSKLKSIDHIKACYELGQRVFGENYVQELCEKERDHNV